VKRYDNNNDDNDDSDNNSSSTIIIIIIIIIIHNNRNTAHVECKNKGDAGNNRSNWNHLKSFRKYLSSVPGKHEVKELQKTAIMGTAHTLRKVLM
jgi:hypothetical protein